MNRVPTSTDEMAGSSAGDDTHWTPQERIRLLADALRDVRREVMVALDTTDASTRGALYYIRHRATGALQDAAEDGPHE